VIKAETFANTFNSLESLILENIWRFVACKGDNDRQDHFLIRQILLQV